MAENFFKRAWQKFSPNSESDNRYKLQENDLDKKDWYALLPVDVQHDFELVMAQNDIDSSQVRTFIDRHMSAVKEVISRIPDTATQINVIEKLLEPKVPPRWIALGIMQLVAVTMLAACGNESANTTQAFNQSETAAHTTEMASAGNDEMFSKETVKWSLTAKEMLQELTSKGTGTLSTTITTKTEENSFTQKYEVTYRFDNSGNFSAEGYKDSRTITFFHNGENLANCTMYLKENEAGQDEWFIITAYSRDTERLKLTIEHEKIDNTSQQVIEITLPAS